MEVLRQLPKQQDNPTQEQHKQENITQEQHKQENVTQKQHKQENATQERHKQENIAHAQYKQKNITQEQHRQENVTQDQSSSLKPHEPEIQNKWETARKNLKSPAPESLLKTLDSSKQTSVTEDLMCMHVR